MSIRPNKYPGTCPVCDGRVAANAGYLMRNADHVLSRTQIAQHVWSFDFYGDFKVIDVYIGYLRRKIDQQGSPSLIRTVRGVGYSINVHVEAPPAE